MVAPTCCLLCEVTHLHKLDPHGCLSTTVQWWGSTHSFAVVSLQVFAWVGRIVLPALSTNTAFFSFCQGHIKGYISHQHQKLVVSKQNPFPPLSTVCCWVLHLSHASTLQILSLPSGTAPSHPEDPVNGLVHVQDQNTRNCLWLLSQNGQGCQVHWNDMLTFKW